MAMYLLPENSRRRQNVIAGLTSALVGMAMIAMAGKASAMHEDRSAAASEPAATHDDHAAAEPPAGNRHLSGV
jgi:hypothetical protein